MSTEHRSIPPRWRTACAVLLLVTLASMALIDYKNHFVSAGIDFYSFWEIGEARRVSGHTLGSPYTGGFRYVQAGKQVVLNSFGDDALVRNALYWHGADWNRGAKLLPTPLLYASFAVFPSSFSNALNVYNWVAVVLFLLSMLLLGYALFLEPLHRVLAALVPLVSFYPLTQDFHYANVNSVLMFGLASFLASAVRARKSGRKESLFLRLYMCAGLIVLTLFKPLVLLPCFLLLIWLFANSDSGDRWPLAMMGGIALAFGLIVPSLYFGSWTIWVDWFTYVGVQHNLLLPLSSNNHSLTMLSAEWIGLHPLAISLVFGGACLWSALWAMRGRQAHSIGGSLRRLSEALRDPVLVVSIGILMTLATAPLVWPHYNVLAIIPALWLATRPTQRAAFQALVFIVWLVNADVLIAWLTFHDLALPKLLILGGTWIPLWIGIVAAIRADGDRASRRWEDLGAVTPESSRGGTG